MSNPHCSVSGCKDEPQNFKHSFPFGNTDLREQWFIATSLDGKRGKYVCSDHFKETDYVNNDKSSNKLKTFAVPSLNLPISGIELEIETDMRSTSPLNLLQLEVDKYQGKSAVIKEPVIKFSEEKYKSLLHDHNLSDDSDSTMSAAPEEDPLSLEPKREYVIIKEEIEDEEYENPTISAEEFSYLEISETQVDNPEFRKKNRPTKRDKNKKQGSDSSKGMSCSDIDELLVVSRTSDVEISDEPETTNKVKVFDQQKRKNAKKKVVEKKVPERSKQPVDSKSSSKLVIVCDPTLLDKNKTIIEKKLEYDHSFHLNEILDDDQKLLMFTGITSDVFNVCIRCFENNMFIKKQKVKDSNVSVALTLTKIKLNLPFNILAVLFSLTVEEAENYFYSTLGMLGESLKSTIVDVSSYVPVLSQYNGNIRTVLKEVQFNVTKCEEENCKVPLCKEYRLIKHIRLIVGMSQNGIYNFVSNIYDTNIFFKYIFNKEVYFLKCKKTDIVILSNFNFHEKANFTVFSLDEMSAEESKYLNSLVGRIMDFKFLMDGEIHAHMIPHMASIFHIICGVMNLNLQT